MTKLPYPLKSQLSKPDELESMEAKYISAKPLIKFIVQTIDDTVDKSIKLADSDTLFEDPNWAYQSAYNAGFRQGLRTSRKIIIKE
tara:strand:- start:7198 stop:7455 length:258 start_codon:yes stop_codon:yes gene_type:complete